MSTGAKIVTGKPLLLIDLETTGVDSIRDSVVQLAAATLSPVDLRVEKVFTSLVKPETSVNTPAQKIHGLTESDLVGAPDLAEAIERFDQFAPADALLAGHNVSFDVSFLKVAYQAVGRDYRFDYHTLDIWSVAFLALSAQGVKLDRYSLDELCELFDLERNRYHDAEQDVRVSAEILRRLYKELAQAEISFS